MHDDLACTDPLSERLSDYIDGDLAPEMWQRVHAHVTGCGACTAVAADLRAVKSWLGQAALPSSARDPIDDWPRIRDRIAEPVTLRSRSRSASWAIASMAAAAILVVIVQGVFRSPEPPASPAAIDILASGYRTAISDLEGIFEQEGRRLPPDVAHALERNIALIDGAIGQTEQALAEQPDNEFIVRYLEMLRRRKLDALRDAASIVAART